MTSPETRIDRNSLRGRLILMLAAMVTASVLAVGFAAISAFDRAVEPELANRTRLIGTIIRSELQRALELGIPIDAVAGLDRYLNNALENFGEVERIAITTTGGKQVAQAERPAAPSLMMQTGLGEVIAVRRTAFELPILHGNRLVGQITVKISPHFVQTRLRDVFLDVLVLGLIATLVALELVLAVAVSSVGKPLDRVFHLLAEQREGDFRHRIRPGGLGGLGRTAARLNDHAEDLATRLATIPAALRVTIGAQIATTRPLRLRLSDLNDIRLALFLFSVATEISSAFMPLFARAAERPDWLSPEIAAAAPLVFYLGAIAALSPFGSTLVRRFGARNLFLFSVPGAGVALVGLGLSTSLIGITLWQGVMAAFYASATIACQEYAIRAAGGKGGARAVGAYVAVIYGGLFCGSALGGLLAGRFGFETAFLTGAALAAVSLVLGAASMRGRAGDREQISANAAPDTASQRGWLTGRYLALLLGVGVPMNATMVIFIWYLTPLMLSDIGSGPAEIARVLILYNLAILLLGPVVARLADSRIGPVILLVAGALGSAAALLSLTVWSGFWAIAIAVTGVGASQILIETPLFTLALRITGGPGPGIDALRLIERIGAILGLAASAVLLGMIGAEASIRLLGFFVLVGVAVYVIVEFAGRSRRIGGG
jgi:predicted MFS family arabinose efflux permease